MTDLEWEFVKSFYRDEFGSEMRGLRWQRKLGHLERQRVIDALYLHGEESNTKPTLRQVMDCLPKGLVRRGKPDHIHAWEELPLAHGEPGNLVWCPTCGDHSRHRCYCKSCLCDHSGAVRVSPLFYECGRCGCLVRASSGEPAVPF